MIINIISEKKPIAYKKDMNVFIATPNSEMKSIYIFRFRYIILLEFNIFIKKWKHVFIMSDNNNTFLIFLEIDNQF